jgi:2-hydroxychromene-2-carboxylate isomerase
MERLTASYGQPFRRPSVFPRNGLLAARVALIAADEGWCGPFARAVYAANFAEDRDIATRDVVGAVLAGLGRDPGDVFARAEAPEMKARLREQSSRAVELGIFGAPSFVTRGELFWGNDRLEQALAWSRGSEPAISG